MCATASIGIDLEIGSQEFPEKLNMLAPSGVFVNSDIREMLSRPPRRRVVS